MYTNLCIQLRVAFFIFSSSSHRGLAKAHMVKSLEIPQDIIYNVIAAVGDDTDVLKQCALVSSSFLLPSRKQLFSRITLRNVQTCRGIHQFLAQNPVILSFVRSITLTDRRAWGFGESKFPRWINGTWLLAILRLPFCRLERFSICGSRFSMGFSMNHSYWNWNGFSSELKDALSNIVHSSTLKTLSLRDITNVPITFFLHLHLTTLDLFLSLDDFCDENSNLLTRVASKGVAPIASRTVIDRCVWYLMEEESGPGTRLPSSSISH
jgi:hypothetical protein